MSPINCVVVILLISNSVDLGSALVCQTDGNKDETVAPCVLPFIHQGQTFNSCTNVTDNNGRFWCSTKVDEEGNHIKGNWGYCDPAVCILGDNIRCANTNEEGPKKNQDCVFPFIKSGVKYESCTNDDEEDKTKFWCSTSVNDQGIHQRGNWGYCSPGCEPYVGPKNGESTSAAPIIETGPASGGPKDQGADNVPRKVGGPAVPDDYPYLGGYNATIQPTLDDPENYCGRVRTKDQIVGGRLAKKGSYPFIAALGYKNTKTQGPRVVYACGGSLINRRYVVTAAHCHSEKDPIVEVLLGAHNFNKDDECPDDQDSGEDCPTDLQRFAIRTQDVLVHEKFVRSSFHAGFDIALVRLPGLAITPKQNSNSKVLPVCLNWRHEAIPSGTLHVAGWGRTTTDKWDAGELYKDGATSSILQELKVPQVQIDDCKQFFRDLLVNDENHICAGGDKGRDSCNGDSGGPLVNTIGTDRTLKMYLVGVVSFGSSNCNGGSPGVYTKVENFIEWIVNNMRP